MSFAVGNLVRARGREWVVLPDSTDDLLVLRPLGGTEAEVAGIHLDLETVEPAQFDLPDPSKAGDYRSGRLLHDAIRLGFRSSAGPFRSFARLSVEPRPYQLVPLLMALKLNPVRLLIADDVGIGKTIEAGLIARELLDRGEIQRLAVLCPPHLAEQWQAELRDKFHIEAELVLSSTAGRLEKHCRVGQSLFDVHPFVIVSTDFIKTDRRRDDFIRACPEFVIVDEAHTCAYAGERRSSQHKRHRLIYDLSAEPDRHLILVTATLHSGKEEAFRSLLTLINRDFKNLPPVLTGQHNEPYRRLAEHFVQRRRADIRNAEDWLEDTPFPERDEAEATYDLSPAYRRLFDRVLDYTRETVREAEGGTHRQRVRWWSALALLRSLASSPAAAASTLRNRAASANTTTPEEADEIGRHRVLDLIDDESGEGMDVVHGSDPGEEGEEGQKLRRRLLDLARQADSLCGEEDAKLQKAVELVRTLVRDGYRPILFCRFVPTAEYVAEALRERLRGVEVAAVTGLLAPVEREARVRELGEAEKPVLVATDCLSEGINLQDHFDAVIHYDLSWNPTRHEQREGRVDRYGQPRALSGSPVRVITYYGRDNQIDGIVLDVLLRKHKKIRSALGISVPVPVDSNQVVEAIFEGLVLRGQSVSVEQLNLFEDLMEERDLLHSEWERASEKEKASRTMFAQRSIKVDDVARELQDVRAAMGSHLDVERFVDEAVRLYEGVVHCNGATTINLDETPRALRDAVGGVGKLKARFVLPVQEGEVFLSRTHPVVEGLATYVMDTALDGIG
ncbi:MAG: DEAD/DEAH box helicase, partial [Bacteroidetes bacterium]|nr:DEAD/DEAH box helicase [Bacteroidota bacterium]